MSNANWIEVLSPHRKVTPEEVALRETYGVAQKIGFQLLCASNQLLGVESPDVTACAAVVREAIHKPEKDRANAVKAAEAAVLGRQVNYISTLLYYQQHLEEWRKVRPILVAQLEAVVAPPKEAGSHGSSHHIGLDLSLNCESVVNLIDASDIAINEATKRHSQPTQKHAQAAFQKVFDALAAEVSDPHWISHVRLSWDASFGKDIFCDIPVDKISSTDVSPELVKCCALDATRGAFEHVFNYNLTSSCRDFRQETRGSFNDTQLSESLLAAMPNVSAMIRIEENRDIQLRAYARKWRSLRSLIETAQMLFGNVAELLPEAIAEAAAIEDETMRRRAQNLCLFAARRLKENLKFVRECNRFVSDRDSNRIDIHAAVDRGHQALVDRITSKKLNYPTTRCREEAYMG